MCTINIGLTAHMEGEVAGTAAEVITSAEETIDTVTTVTTLPFREQDREKAIVEADGGIKGPAKGDAMSVDDKDAGRNIIPGKNGNDPSTTSASNTSL